MPTSSPANDGSPPTTFRGGGDGIPSGPVLRGTTFCLLVARPICPLLGTRAAYRTPLALNGGTAAVQRDGPSPWPTWPFGVPGPGLARSPPPRPAARSTVAAAPAFARPGCRAPGFNPASAARAAGYGRCEPPTGPGGSRSPPPGPTPTHGPCAGLHRPHPGPTVGYRVRLNVAARTGCWAPWVRTGRRRPRLGRAGPATAAAGRAPGPGPSCPQAMVAGAATGSPTRAPRADSLGFSRLGWPTCTPALAPIAWRGRATGPAPSCLRDVRQAPCPGVSPPAMPSCGRASGRGHRRHAFGGASRRSRCTRLLSARRPAPTWSSSPRPLNCYRTPGASLRGFRRR